MAGVTVTPYVPGAPTATVSPAPAAPLGQPTNSVEAPQAPTQADPNDLSTKFAHLARKTKAFRDEQRRFQAEREAFKTQEAEYRKAIEFQSRIGNDPLGVLAERGVARDQLASLLLNEQNPQEANLVFQLQQQNKELHEQIQKINKRFEDNDSQAYQGALNQIGYDAKILVESDPSAYELTSKAGEDGIEAIKHLCKITFEEDGHAMDVQTAAEMVEQELLERSLALAGSNKVKAKLFPTPQPEPTKQQPIPGKSQPTRTLNSQATQGSNKPMSARERAIAAFKGQL